MVHIYGAGKWKILSTDHSEYSTSFRKSLFVKMKFMTFIETTSEIIKTFNNDNILLSENICMGDSLK